MIKKIGILLVTVLGGALLVYSATRSLDFISLTLPADRQVLAYFGLAALDGGLVAWLLSYLNGSRGAWQRAISILMVCVDVVGAIGMFTMDTLYNAGKNGMTKAMTPEEMTNAILALSGIIALNIIATVAHHITDPDKLREQAEEEAFAKVEDATLKQIAKNADTLAANLAPVMAADWQAQTQARYMSYVGTGQRPTIDVTARDVMPVLPMMDEPKQPVNLGVLWSGLVNAATGKGANIPAPVVIPEDNKQETKAAQDDLKAYTPQHTAPKPNRLTIRQTPDFKGYDDPERLACFEDATEGETTVQNVLDARLCDCPPVMFDPNHGMLTGETREKVKRFLQPYCVQDWIPKGTGYTKAHRPNARADATCGRCPYFTGEYAKDDKSFTDAPKS
jgi:hypothetical protein